jgi:hypothetical protein
MKRIRTERASEISVGPDPSWRELYQAGGACALFYVVFGMFVPEVLFLTSRDTSMSGADTLQYIASHQASWIIVQLLSLGLSIVAMVVFLALKHLNKSYEAIGTIIALTSQALILSYWPITMGQLSLSQRYLVSIWWAFYLVWLITVGWKLFRLGTQSGSLLRPSNNVKLRGGHQS